MTCHGIRHVWAYTSVNTGHPPEGMACQCGGYVWREGLPGIVATDGVSSVYVADETMPSGLCSRCNRPLDDHIWDAKGPLCPAKVANR